MRIVNFLGVTGCALARPRGPGPCAGSNGLSSSWPKPGVAARGRIRVLQLVKAAKGFDPMAAPQATVPPPQQQGRQASPLGGAARGAATGGLVGGLRRSQQRQHKEQADLRRPNRLRHPADHADVL